MDAGSISDDELYLGVEVLDDEHRQLLGIMNRLLTACHTSSGSQDIDGLVAELVDYTQAHFRSEEALMARKEYDRFERHKTEHDNLLSTLQVMLRPVPTKVGYDIGDETFGFLRTWLVEHILGEDKRLAAFLEDLD